MLATADLVVLVLRVLPGKIREWLNAERNLPGKRKDGRARLTRRASIGDLDKHGGRRETLALSRPAKTVRDEMLERR